MLEVFGIVLAVTVGIVFTLLLLWFAMGAMHGYLLKRGESFGRDAIMHDKLDRIIQGQKKGLH